MGKHKEARTLYQDKAETTQLLKVKEINTS